MHACAPISKQRGRIRRGDGMLSIRVCWPSSAISWRPLGTPRQASRGWVHVRTGWVLALCQRPGPAAGERPRAQHRRMKRDPPSLGTRSRDPVLRVAMYMCHPRPCPHTAGQAGCTLTLPCSIIAWRWGLHWGAHWGALCVPVHPFRTQRVHHGVSHTPIKEAFIPGSASGGSSARKMRT